MAASIAVVIPTLNEERVLSRTLLSLRQFRFDQVVLVDGGSRDQTVSIAQGQLQGLSLHPAKVMIAEQGRARQMNAGARATHSDVLLFLHADTLLPPETRTEIERILENSKYVGGRFDVRFEDDRGWAWLISRLMNWRSRWSGIATGDQALFVRRSVFDDLGGFADVPLMEDVELTRRLKRMGSFAALRATVTTSFRRWQRQGTLRTVLQMWLLRFLYWVGVPPRMLQQFYVPIR
ncbi:MAG: TIGR04283 family arsenosugar biosynthesis glycosyltransferase [Nitrospira sp.]|nr:TIGR04283 family arsenosugar biosynthesis glycosyltransferase [Nitrospira sp.]